MKKICSIIALLTVMALLLTGCGSKTDDISTDTIPDDGTSSSARTSGSPAGATPEAENQPNISENSEQQDTEETKKPEKIEIPVPETGTPSTKAQIELMADSLKTWAQEEEFANDSYSYTVTDLDSNGYLELIASRFGGTGHFTYSRIYEVNEDGTELILCDRGVEEGDSEADIVVSSAECYVDLETMTICYIFYDYMKVSAAEYYTGMRSLIFSDKQVTETQLASLTQTYEAEPDNAGGENTQEENVGDETQEPACTCVYKNADGREITEEEYLAAADSAYSAYEKHSVSMYWQTFVGDELHSLFEMSRDDIVFMLNQSFGNFAVS